MTLLPDAIEVQVLSSFANATKRQTPYDYWLVQNCLPAPIVDEVLDLPLRAAGLDGVSGRRELHNDKRRYFDVGNRNEFPVVAAVARAFQSPGVTSSITELFGVSLKGTYLRIEFAQDTDGFWLEPHTDIGV